MARHSLEMKFQIWDDDHGERIEIGEDPDGLDMMEIRQVDPSGKILARINFDEKVIPLAIEAMQRFQAWKAEKKPSQG